MIGERRLQSITTSPAHLQRLAHLNEQSGEGLALVVMAVTSEPSFGTHANPFANIALQGQSIDSKEIDRRSVQNACVLHRFFKISRRGKVLSLLRVFSIEDDNNFALVAIGGVGQRINHSSAASFEMKADFQGR